MSNNKSTKGSDSGYASVGNTANAFNARLQRQKDQMLKAVGEAEQDSKRRNALILRAMTEARRALMDVEKLDLGNNFEFSLDIDDWDGWPRVIVRLLNQDDAIQEFPSLVVSANDRRNIATIEISPGTKSPLVAYQLPEQDKENRFATILRRSVRAYLDEVSIIVLDYAKPNQQFSKDPVVKLSESPKSVTREEKMLSSVDLFCDQESNIGDFDSVQETTALDDDFFCANDEFREKKK